MRIVYEKNGIAAIVIPSNNWLAIEGNDIDKLVTLTVPPGVPHEILEDNEIPSDRLFRNAWKAVVGSGIIINITLARGIHLERIIRAKDKALLKKDKELEAAIDSQDAVLEAQIRADRIGLRDLPATLTPTIENAPNVTALVAITGGLVILP